MGGNYTVVLIQRGRMSLPLFLALLSSMSFLSCDPCQPFSIPCRSLSAPYLPIVGLSLNW